MPDLHHILFKMPNDWGKSFTPAIHPSSCQVPSDPRIFMFAVRLGWVRPSFAEALRVGDIFHSYMEHRYANPEVDEIGLINRVTTDAESEILERQETIAKTGEEPPSGEMERKAIGIGTMLGKVFDELFPIPNDWYMVAVEQAMKLSLPSIADDLAGSLVGKVDAVTYVGHKDEYWLIDHKSTSEAPEVRARGLMFDTQAKLYRMLWEKAHPDKPLAGVIHNIIRKPTIKPKKNETYEEYINRCFEWYDDKAQVSGGLPPVRQSWVRFAKPPAWEDEELMSLLRNVYPWYTCRLSLEKFYRSGIHHHYTRFNRLTPYMDLLEMPPAQWYDYLATHGFEKRHPDSRYDTEEDND